MALWAVRLRCFLMTSRSSCDVQTTCRGIGGKEHGETMIDSCQDASGIWRLYQRKKSCLSCVISNRPGTWGCSYFKILTHINHLALAHPQVSSPPSKFLTTVSLTSNSLFYSTPHMINDIFLVTIPFLHELKHFFSCLENMLIETFSFIPLHIWRIEIFRLIFRRHIPNWIVFF